MWPPVWLIVAMTSVVSVQAGTQETALPLPGGRILLSKQTVLVDQVSKNKGETFAWINARFDATNQTDRQIESFAIAIDTFGPSGTLLKFETDVHSCEAKAESLGIGAKKTLTCRWPILVPIGTKKEQVELGRTEYLIVGADYPVTYEISLAKPVPSLKRTFEDELIEVTFLPVPRQIGLSLRNKSDSALKIEWDQVAIVGLAGRSMKVIHEGVRYAERDRPMPPTTVPPGARIDDLIVPAESVSYSSGIALSTTYIPGSWIVSPFLPDGLQASKLVGQEFGLFVPVSVAGKSKEYNFRFRIDAVK